MTKPNYGITLQVNVSRETYQWLLENEKTNGVGISEFCRGAIDREMEREKLLSGDCWANDDCSYHPKPKPPSRLAMQKHVDAKGMAVKRHPLGY